ncbi:MAG: hypothetical protein HKN58_08055 [Xanthomonadales bacterium]|nr:hypothetical protein [Xanthomonadales bacterium]
MLIDRPAIRRRALPLTMLAVGVCLLLTGGFVAPTLLIPGAFYICIGLRGLYVTRQRESASESEFENNGASGYSA